MGGKGVIIEGQHERSYGVGTEFGAHAHIHTSKTEDI